MLNVIHNSDRLEISLSVLLDKVISMENTDNAEDVSMANYSRFVEVGTDEQSVTTNIMIDVTIQSFSRICRRTPFTTF